MTNQEKVKPKKQTADFATIIQEHASKVFNMAFKILQDRQEAEDAAQEIFFKVYQSYHSYHGNASLQTWIVKITVNYCIDLLRKKRRRFQYTPLGDQLPHDTGNSPEAMAIAKETAALIQQEILKFPPETQTILALRLYYGFTYEYISSLLEIPSDNAKVRFYRARQILKQRLLAKGIVPHAGKVVNHDL